MRVFQRPRATRPYRVAILDARPLLVAARDALDAGRVVTLARRVDRVVGLVDAELAALETPPPDR